MTKNTANGAPKDLLDWLDDMLPGESSQVVALLQGIKKTPGEAEIAQFNTPYKNTLSAENDPKLSVAEREQAQALLNAVCWNGACAVFQASDKKADLGGHLSTFASSAVIYETLQNYFLKQGDLLLPQGHAAPGLYARAFLEGRITEAQLKNFRQESIGGLSSYPHPRRMPDFWQIPTVSMGLAGLTAIALARFRKYLISKKLGENVSTQGRVVSILGDGELEEPETLAGIWLAGRERLDNLWFVVNANLQRLDGPTRPSGKLIQDTERIFRAADWEVIKVVWSSDWDPIFARDQEGKLLARLESFCDGDFQELSTLEQGAAIRAKLSGGNPDIAHLLAPFTDDDMLKLRRGGHDPAKIYAAFAQAAKVGRPVVILAKTLKGNGLGSGIAGQMTAHGAKNLSAEGRIALARRLQIPISGDEAAAATFYKPTDDAPEMHFLQKQRSDLGGFLPERKVSPVGFPMPPEELFRRFDAGGKTMMSTKSFMDLLRTLLKECKNFVTIIPDEGQTFGADLIYAEQKIWNPIANESVAGLPIYKNYKESRTGGVFQEGINEAGAMATFTAAGTSYALNGVPICPFYIFYSMFGFQRTADSIWAAADALCRGFLLGGTAGGTTLNGEGLQHQDRASHLMALTNPAIVAYDPATSWEVASLVRTGVYRMFGDTNEDVMFYITLYNEMRPMPARPPEATDDAIAKGIYRLRRSQTTGKGTLKAHLLASGTILFDALQAAEILENEGIPTDVWSVTSWTELNRDADRCRQHNLFQPGNPPHNPHLSKILADESGVFVAVSDWMRILPASLEPCIPGPFAVLGTDGFGFSDSRENLRRFFKISPAHAAFAALRLLAATGKFPTEKLSHFQNQHSI